MALIRTGTDGRGMPQVGAMRGADLPTYEIGQMTVRPGDVVQQVKPGTLVSLVGGHTFLVEFDRMIRHNPGPPGVFGYGQLNSLLAEGGYFTVLYPTRSLEETFRRFGRADTIMGKSWWQLNCQQATDFIVGVPNRLAV